MRTIAVFCLFLFSLYNFSSAEEKEKKCLIPGIEFESLYTGEVFSKISGGIDKKEDAEYRGNFDFTINLDTEKSGLWQGGTIFLYFENGHGEGITNKYVGDIQVLSNIDARDFTQISEYYISQNLINDRLCLKLGKQNANNDFNVAENAGEFLNSSFGIMPNVPLPTFPEEALGAQLFIGIKENLSLSAGIFDGEGKGGKFGFDTAFCSDATSVSVVETSIGYAPAKRGNLKLGMWRHGGSCNFISKQKSKNSNTGAYIIIEQGLIGEKDSNKFCLDSFFQYGYADKNINEIPNYFGAGLSAHYLFQNRPDDCVGIGFASAGLNKDIPGIKTETAIETYYLARIKEAFLIQPDIQYIINPGGTENNTFAFGVRFYLNYGI